MISSSGIEDFNLQKSIASIQAVTGQKPIWRYQVDGEVSFYIERYIFDIRSALITALTQPLLMVHLGGKKVISLDTGESLSSFPSVTTLLPPGKETRWKISGVLDFAVIYFKGSALKNITELIKGHTDPLGLNDTLCVGLIKQLSNHIQTEKCNPIYIQALSNALVCHIEQKVKQSDRLKFNPINCHLHHINKATKFIQQNLASSLSSVEISKHIGLKESYFREIFKTSTGYSVHKFVIEQRLDRVKDLLHNSSLSLTEIAIETGFSNQSHMSSAFKRYCHTTPGKFRSQTT